MLDNEDRDALALYELLRDLAESERRVRISRRGVAMVGAWTHVREVGDRGVWLGEGREWTFVLLSAIDTVEYRLPDPGA